MNKLYEAFGRFLFVPVVRERLAFAVVVQRLSQQLKLGTGDIVAVEMPDSVGRRLQASLHDPDAFLDVHLIMTRESRARKIASAPREVFAITPCDAVVEAVRIAMATRARIEYIDAELDPSSLRERTCQHADDLPDDSWALTEGVHWYFRQALRLLSESRDAAVDAGREAHMANRL